MGTSKKPDALPTPRFDFGSYRTAGNEIGTLKELLAEINAENWCTEEKDVTIQTLAPLREGIRKVIGKDITDSTVATLPLTDLKTIKLLYRTNDDGDVHLFDLIAPPDLKNKANLEFRTELPIPRTDRHTRMIASMQEALCKEIPSERLARIDRNLTSLPEMLLSLQKQNEVISEQLSRRFDSNSEAKATAYRTLVGAISAYVPYSAPASNPLHEAIFTYLRTLRFKHFAAGYENLMAKASIKQGITPIGPELIAFYAQISQRMGRPLSLPSPVTSIRGFPDFVEAWAPQLIKLVVKATGFSTKPRQLRSLVERARRVLHLYCVMQLGERHSDTVALSPYDCVAALCTIRHEQAIKTKHEPYWHAQKSPGGSLLGSLKANRRIEDLFKEDYVPHEINQIIYYRLCAMGSALVGATSYHDAWMAFQIARVTKYAECLLSNDIDVITRAVLDYQMSCLEMVATFNAHGAPKVSTVMERAARWTARKT